MFILFLIILSSTTYAISSSDNYLQCVTNTILRECESVNEIQTFTNESIFNFLKNFDRKFLGNVRETREKALICILPDDDYQNLLRNNPNDYSFYKSATDEESISCPPIINNNILNQIGLINFYNNINISLNFKILVTISFVLNIISISYTLFYLTLKFRKNKIKKSLPRNR